MKGFEKIIKLSKKKKLRVKAPSYKVPDWFSKIKPSTAHGSTPSQKKAWRVVSEYVRQRDWKKGCVSCRKPFERWEDAQAGHYIPWSTCHGIFKYDLRNLAAQCGHDNAWGGGKAGYDFANELVRRRGADIINQLEYENELFRGKKIEEWELVEMVAKLAPHLVV